MTCIKVMHMARVPRIDMSLALFIALAYYFFLRGYQEEQRRRSSYLWAFFFMALSFLDKGPVGVGLPAGGMFIFLIPRPREVRKAVETVHGWFTQLLRTLVSSIAAVD